MPGLAPLLALALAAWPDLAQPPAATGGGEHDAAVIVGIGRYAEVPPVPGAVENADAWFEYLARTRKVPLESITLLRDKQATVGKLRKYAAEAARQVKPGGLLWFVFIGHGAPSADGKDGVLVGYDAQQDVDVFYERSLPKQELLGLLAAGQGRPVVVLDACFSGQTRERAPLIKGLQPLLPVQAAPARAGEALVLTAGRGDEFAGPLPGAERPAFSYLVLGALRGWADADGDGRVTAEEVLAYSRSTLRALVKDRTQTPELSGVSSLVLATSSRERGPDLVELVRTAGAPAPAPTPGPTPAPAPAPQPRAAPAPVPTQPPTKQEKRAEYERCAEAFRRSDWASSEACFQHLLGVEDQPGPRAVLLYNLGLVHERLGRAADAARDYRQALQADSGFRHREEAEQFLAGHPGL